MQTLNYIFLFFLALLGMQSCDESRLNLDIAIVPREVTNFTEVNSSYDDYNSAGPLYFAGDAFSLVFSTNRNSNGADFDLISYQCYINYDQVNISFDIWPDSWEYPLVDSMNSTHNEWGPYLTFDILGSHTPDYDPEWETLHDTSRFFFSSDRDGNQDIYYCYYSPGGAIIPGQWPVSLSSLNTEFEEGYLCLHQETATSQEAATGQEAATKQESAAKLVYSSNRETCYFTSDRNGNFDIYSAAWEGNRRIETSGTLEVGRVDVLSSAADDKCPYIVNDMMVFTSDREGGQGGFDLWYSVYSNGTWSAPENFGPGINTEYDEYRPVIIPLQPDLFVNDMLIFSSNRPGGRGGFDLYYVGMDKRGTTAASGL